MASRTGSLGGRWLQAVVATAMLAIAVLGVIVPIVGPSGLGGDALTVEAAQLDVRVDVPAAEKHGLGRTSADTVASTERPARLASPYQAAVSLPSPAGWERAVFVGTRVLEALAVLLLLGLVVMLVRSVDRGDPFAARNADLVRGTGLVLMAYGLIFSPLRQAVDNLLVERSVAAPLVVQSVTVSFVPAFVGVLLLVLGEVFRRGATMRADLEAVV